MNKEQLSEHIGNIDEKLIQQAEHTPNYRQRTQKHRIKQLAACIAVVLLMLGSFVTGAVVFAKETIVEVPVEQETIALEDIGLTLILPDNWKNRYAVESGENGAYIVYNKDIRSAFTKWADMGEDAGGVLFYLIKWPEQLTEEQVNAGGEWDYAANQYVMTTKEGTYLLYYASDVQFTPDTEDEYQQMSSEIGEIRFVVEHALAG